MGDVSCSALQYFRIGELDANPYIIWDDVLNELYFLVLIIAVMSFHKENGFGFTYWNAKKGEDVPSAGLKCAFATRYLPLSNDNVPRNP